ncbi:MAG TPA: histidinol dehydrogenase, partial [Candidatus Olsenella avistercoris]|nr:histidinol dehydrogenase [Candidatus Olsenella avistercoris]
MRTVTLSAGRRLSQSDLNRTGALPEEVMAAAEKIVDDVRERGDTAVRECCLRFDRACPASFRVPDELVAGALELVPPEFLAALT